jgi:hypothetical protein
MDGDDTELAASANISDEAASDATALELELGRERRSGSRRSLTTRFTGWCLLLQTPTKSLPRRAAGHAECATGAAERYAFYSAPTAASSALSSAVVESAGMSKYVVRPSITGTAELISAGVSPR